MENLWWLVGIITGFAIIAIGFSLLMRNIQYKSDLKTCKSDISYLEEQLKLKEKEFEVYRHTSDLEKIKTAEDISKSLFVLENNPKFEKGYNCDEFFVVDVEPKLTYVLSSKKTENISDDIIKKAALAAGLLFNALIKNGNNLGIKEQKLKQLKEKAFEVYYSYTVFSKLDQKTMVVREEYLEAFRENHMNKLNNNNQNKS